jgi:hypothetical protein
LGNFEEYITQIVDIKFDFEKIITMPTKINNNKNAQNEQKTCQTAIKLSCQKAKKN